MKQLHSTILLTYVSSIGGGRPKNKGYRKKTGGANIYLQKRENNSLKQSLITPRLEPMGLVFHSDCTAKSRLARSSTTVEANTTTTFYELQIVADSESQQISTLTFKVWTTLPV